MVGREEKIEEIEDLYEDCVWGKVDRGQ